MRDIQCIPPLPRPLPPFPPLSVSPSSSPGHSLTKGEHMYFITLALPYLFLQAPSVLSSSLPSLPPCFLSCFLLSLRSSCSPVVLPFLLPSFLPFRSFHTSISPSFLLSFFPFPRAYLGSPFLRNRVCSVIPFIHSLVIHCFLPSLNGCFLPSFLPTNFVCFINHCFYFYPSVDSFHIYLLQYCL